MTRPLASDNTPQGVHSELARLRQRVTRLERRPSTAPSGILWANVRLFSKTITPVSSSYFIVWQNLYSNSTTAFQLANVSSGYYDWLQINKPGYYIVRFSVSRSGLYDNTFYTFLQPLFSLAGSKAPIINNMDGRDFAGPHLNTVSEQQIGETAHTNLWHEVAFHYNPSSPQSDLDFENPLKIGCQIATDLAGANVTFGAAIFVERIADAGFTTVV